MSPRNPSRRCRLISIIRLAALAIPVAVLTGTVGAADDSPAAPQGKPAVSARLEAGRVLVLPFRSLGDAVNKADMGTAMADTLAADLAAGRKFEAVRGEASDADSDSAIAKAREKGARYVVLGTIQSYGDDVRVTGQVYDADSRKPIALLRANGNARQFFAVQDIIVHQAQQALSGNGGALTEAPAAPVAARTTPPSSYAPATNVTVTVSATPPARGSYWSEYMDLYEPVPAASGQGSYPATPPTPPQIPSGYSNYSPYAYGGGGFFDGSAVVPSNGVQFFVGPLGTVRTQTFNTLGHSIIDPPPGLSQTGFTTYGQMRPANVPPTPVPAFNQPISAYVNPWAKFASPVGLPQRAAPPNLRPGASVGSSATPAARSASTVRK